MENLSASEGGGDWSGQHGDSPGRFPFGEVPTYIEILPESNREVLVVGDVQACAEFNHRQGDNSHGFEGTCGLVSCEDVLRQFGLDISEAQVVHHAIRHGLCAVDGPPRVPWRDD